MELQEKAENEQADPEKPAEKDAGRPETATSSVSDRSKSTAAKVEQLKITAGDEATMDAAGMSNAEKDLRKTEKRKGGLTKEQRAELHGSLYE